MKILKAVAVIYNVFYFIFILHPAGIISLPMILADAKIFSSYGDAQYKIMA